MPVNFYYEDIDFQLPNEKAVSSWIKNIVKEEKHVTGELSYIFCDDDYLHQINVQYLDHDTYTDIITFDNSEEDKVIEGDIFISIDRIKENANNFNNSETEELHRVMAHGVLHLLGYNDKSESEKAIMREKENFYISLNQ